MADHGGAGWGQFKPALAELAVEKLSPISGEMARWLDDPGEIDRILGQGAEAASAIAAPILAQTMEIMGLVKTRST